MLLHQESKCLKERDRDVTWIQKPARRSSPGNIEGDLPVRSGSGKISAPKYLSVITYKLWENKITS